MNRCILFLLIFFSFGLVRSQSVSTALQELVNAENQFAALSRDKDVRTAFLTFLADSGVVFNQGNAVLGKELWEKRDPSSILLFWWPVFSDVAASGDFGYNTGPYELSQSKEGKPVAFGYFSSVWKKDATGKWKVAIDLGIGFPSPEEKSPPWKTTALHSRKSKKKRADSAHQEFIKWNGNYIAALNRQEVSFLPDHFSREARVHRTGLHPLVTPQDIVSLNEKWERFQFEELGIDVASSGDMAYTYGKVNAIQKADGKSIVSNYLHIWKKEGYTWKLVLDVIGN